MKRFFILLLISVFTIFYTEAKVPVWYETDGLEKIYPDEFFIAEIGYGKTKEAAELDGISRISRFFDTSVKTEINSRETITTLNDKTIEEEDYSKHIEIESEIKLFAVEFSKPYYDGKIKQQVVVAFIDRQKAWEIYKINVQNPALSFLRQYQIASLVTDPLKKLMLFCALTGPADAFTEKYVFGKLLCPSQISEFSNVNDIVVSLPAKIKQFKTECVMSIFVKNDVEGTIKRKLSALLSEKGFTVSDNNAVYKVQADFINAINLNRDEYGTTYVSYPGISISISHFGENIYSYDRNFEKLVSFDKTKNQRMATQIIINDLDVNFIKELTTTYGGQ